MLNRIRIISNGADGDRMQRTRSVRPRRQRGFVGGRIGNKCPTSPQDDPQQLQPTRAIYINAHFADIGARRELPQSVLRTIWRTIAKGSTASLLVWSGGIDQTHSYWTFVWSDRRTDRESRSRVSLPYSYGRSSSVMSVNRSSCGRRAN